MFDTPLTSPYTREKVRTLTDTKKTELITFIKNNLITKFNGINPFFSKTPNKFLTQRNACSFLFNFNSKPLMCELIYALKIIIPQKANGYCLECGTNNCVFLNLPKGYRPFCSNKCKIKNPNRKIKTQQTNLKKYGVSHPSQSKEIKEKTKQTNLKIRGVEAPSQCPKVKEKYKQTCLEKYGEIHFSKTKIFKENFAKRCIEKWGVKTNLQHEDTKAKIRETNLKKWGVTNPSQNPNIIKKIKEVQMSKYGVENIKWLHITNYKNFNKDFVLENFIKDGKILVLEMMEYFNISKTSVETFFKRHGLEYTIPKKFFGQTQHFICNSIDTENKQINNRKIIPPYEIDIFLPDFNLAIEYNGLMFHSRGKNSISKFNTPDFPKDYHLKKTQMCEEKGIQLLHIFEGEDLTKWKSLINSKIGKNTKIYARKCILKEITQKECDEFLEKNHLQGSCNASYRYGLFFNNVLVCVMTFSKSRYNKEYDFELLRFCNLKGYNVIGGASKLLKHFRKHNNGSIISYANRRWSNGNLYEKLGFTKISETKPNYFYFSLDEFFLQSRLHFQKHKLKNKLEDFDQNLSECENMFNNGYRQIFDCGNLVYVLSIRD